MLAHTEYKLYIAGSVARRRRILGGLYVFSKTEQRGKVKFSDTIFVRRRRKNHNLHSKIYFERDILHMICENFRLRRLSLLAEGGNRSPADEPGGEC